MFQETHNKKESGFLEDKNQWKVQQGITRFSEISISDKLTYIILGLQRK
jgi:hypothetical protein